MSVDGGIAGRASQVLVLLVWDVLVGAILPELLGQAKVNGIDKVAFLAKAHEEVVWFDVAVDEVLAMDELNAIELEKNYSVTARYDYAQEKNVHELVRQQQDCLEREPPVAEVEQVLQARPQQLHDQRRELPLRTVVLHRRDADWGERSWVYHKRAGRKSDA